MKFSNCLAHIRLQTLKPLHVRGGLVMICTFVTKIRELHLPDSVLCAWPVRTAVDEEEEEEDEEDKEEEEEEDGDG